MIESIIGRKDEQKKMLALYQSDKAEFVALYGRRRVGKTYLIRQLFDNQFVFDLVGLANATTKEQLFNFHLSVNRFSNHKFKLAKNWLEAFDQLISFVQLSTQAKKILFIDEIPWLDTPRSGFLSALEHFWNGWACSRNDVFLIVCGSATSWIINKLINNHGGLHDRLTASIYLQPFTLHECELFFKAREMEYSRYQIAECYMVLGGIPYYLSKMEKGLSVAQNIDRLYFASSAELKYEFKNLYASLFKNSTDYEQVVRALSKKNKGLTRSEIIGSIKAKSGGGLSTVLKNLEHCGFIRSYRTFGKSKRDTLYQLLDAYTLFYFKYLEANKYNDEFFWTNSLDTPLFHAWSGYAFEMLVLLHVRELKKVLGISGIQSFVSSWRSEKAKPAAQIDLVIDRKDGLIDICEIKFSGYLFTITKTYEANLRNKLAAFKEETKTRKAVHLLMLTTYGLVKNQYVGVVQKEFVLDDLFA